LFTKNTAFFIILLCQFYLY